MVAQENETPEFTEAMQTAHDFQLNLKIEENKHTRAMHAADLGFLGRFFGAGKQTAMFIALVCVIAGILIAFGCYGAICYQPSMSEFWAKQAERGFAFSGMALGFIFGRAMK